MLGKTATPYSQRYSGCLRNTAESVHGEEVYFLRLVDDIIGKEKKINDKEKSRKLTQRNASGG